MNPDVAAQNRITLESAAIQARESGRPVECTVTDDDGNLMGLVIVHEDGKVKMLPKESA